MIKSISIPNKKKVLICYINKKRLLLLNLLKEVLYYKSFPSSFSLNKKSSHSIDFSVFHATFEEKNFANYASKLQQYFYISFKVLVLNGLGLKVRLDTETSSIEFKLGFSHVFHINLDKEIVIKIKKNLIFMQSYNRVKLGNFAFKIKSLRYPDVYKNKGIAYKNENLKLKIIKKK